MLRHAINMVTSLVQRGCSQHGIIETHIFRWRNQLQHKHATQHDVVVDPCLTCRPPVHPLRPPSPAPRPLSPPPLPAVMEGEQAEVLSPTSQLAKDIGLFSPRRLPPKLTNTRIGDAVGIERRPSLERGPSLERRFSLERRSGEHARPFGDAFRYSP